MTAARSLSAARREPINRTRVRGGIHATISFAGAAPQNTQLVVEYRNRGKLLARECRPLATGCTEVAIKTHPRTSHVVCSLEQNGKALDLRCEVAEGPGIEPIGRYFIVIGAMKAGTTTLFNLLARHPAICRTWVEVPGVSFPKEINYFRELYRKGHGACHYDWRFPFDRSQHAWTLDVSPNYAKWPGSKAVPRRIAALPGEVRLAYILREPVDRIESHLAHTLHFTGRLKALNHCIRTSRYALHLDKFTAHFPRESILLLDFDELCRDPSAVLARVCRFLSIEPFDGRTVVHNRRGVEFELDAPRRAELAKALRGDVERLIESYGFEPAKDWLRRFPKASRAARR
jgi:hypothetical protein